MQLSKKITGDLNGTLAVPAGLFALPEKVLQFGTGVLLRGLPDHFIDRANRKNIFNGRIVVVKSTDTGGTDAFREQDGLYTLLERGVEAGKRAERAVINASISRVLSAATEWKTVLACAADPAMQIILSNTTEVGIVLAEEDITAEQPKSFPGRVLDFLWNRYEVFGGDASAGMVIVPTELITDNGNKLKEIVLLLAQRKLLPGTFIDWLNRHNDFCNSLVDCIVPGKLSAKEEAAAEKELGYTDQLMIMSEPYRLWAIETSSERTRAILSFSEANKGVILSPDINKFRELKLRLLNGTHTFSCGLAVLAGFTTVKEAMNDDDFAAFVTTLMNEEIVPLVVSDEITKEEAQQFAAEVVDRFRNPFIEHAWLNITMQYTSKMAMRTIPLVERFYQQYKTVPEHMSLGIAAFIVFMHTSLQADGKFYGTNAGKTYLVQDDKAQLLFDKWKETDTKKMIADILRDTAIFGTDLSGIPGLAASVEKYVSLLTVQGAEKALQSEVKKSLA